MNHCFWSICVACYFFLAVTTAPAAHAFDIAVEVGKPANVSAAIYDSQGRMVRELARALPLPAGRQTLAWDGLDMDGRPAAAGDYEWRSLETQGLRSEYLMSVGDRWWPGNHAGPTSVVVADDSLIVPAHPEGPPLMTRVGFDGRVVWERGPFEPARNPYDIAVGGGKAFYLQDNGKIFVLDFATGKPVGKGQHGTTLSSMVPVKTFVFGNGQAAAGEAAVPLAVIDAKTTTGWNTIEGMKQGSGGITCDAVEPRVFEAPLPNGEYLLRYHYGDDDKPTTLVEVQPNGIAFAAPGGVCPPPRPGHGRSRPSSRPLPFLSTWHPATLALHGSHQAAPPS